MQECENLKNCLFFEVLQGTKLQDMTYDLISLYCRGPFVTECHRKQKIDLGRMPSRELSPAGVSFNI